MKALQPLKRKTKVTQTIQILPEQGKVILKIRGQLVLFDLNDFIKY